jgi:hypothetical protein
MIVDITFRRRNDFLFIFGKNYRFVCFFNDS